MPLLDLRLMAIRSFRRGVVVGTLFFFTTAFYLTFSLYQQQGLGTDPLHTGLAILPYGAGLFIGPLASGPLVRRLGKACCRSAWASRWPATAPPGWRSGAA